MTYPSFIKCGNTKYPINTDFRYGIACFKAINDNSISDSERVLAIITLLLGNEVKEEHYEEAFEKCAIYLRCGKETNAAEEDIDLDYVQDEAYIMASFRSCYKINLTQEKMHWYEYNDLIVGLVDTILNNVRQIRNYDINKISDLEERERIINLQNQLAIKGNKSRQEELDDDLFLEQMGMR